MEDLSVLVGQIRHLRNSQDSDNNKLVDALTFARGRINHCLLHKQISVVDEWFAPILENGHKDELAEARCISLQIIKDVVNNNIERLVQASKMLLNLINDSNVIVIQQAMSLYTSFLPHVLKKIVQSDIAEGRQLWKVITDLNNAVLHVVKLVQLKKIPSAALMGVFKFLSVLILCYTSPVHLEGEVCPIDFDASQIPSDHAILKKAMMLSEAQQVAHSLAQSLASPTHNSSNLLSLVECIANICRYRFGLLKILLPSLFVHAKSYPNFHRSLHHSVFYTIRVHFIILLKHIQKTVDDGQGSTSIIGDTIVEHGEVLSQAILDLQVPENIKTPFVHKYATFFAACKKKDASDTHASSKSVSATENVAQVKQVKIGDPEFHRRAYVDSIVLWQSVLGANLPLSVVIDLVLENMCNLTPQAPTDNDAFKMIEKPLTHTPHLETLLMHAGADLNPPPPPQPPTTADEKANVAEDVQTAVDPRMSRTTPATQEVASFDPRLGAATTSSAKKIRVAPTVKFEPKVQLLSDKQQLHLLEDAFERILRADNFVDSSLIETISATEDGAMENKHPGLADDNDDTEVMPSPSLAAPNPSAASMNLLSAYSNLSPSQLLRYQILTRLASKLPVQGKCVENLTKYIGEKPPQRLLLAKLWLIQEMANTSTPQQKEPSGDVKMEDKEEEKQNVIGEDEEIHGAKRIKLSSSDSLVDIKRYQQIFLRLLARYIEYPEMFQQLVLQAPIVPQSVMKGIEELVINKDMQRGLAILRDLVLKRLPYQDAALQKLLEYTHSPKEQLQSLCVRLITNRVYLNPSLLSHVTSSIEEKALSHIKTLLVVKVEDTREEGELDPDAKDSKVDVPGTTSRAESLTKTHSSLFFALCTKNILLLKHLFEIYPNLSPALRAPVRKQSETLMRSLCGPGFVASNPQVVSEILSQENYEGVSSPVELMLLKFLNSNTVTDKAEGLLLLFFHIFCETAKPSQAMVDSVYQLYQGNQISARFLVPMLKEFSKPILINITPSLLALPQKPVKVVVQTLIRETKSVLPPGELLVLLHSIEAKDQNQMKNVIMAIQMCMDTRSVFTQTIIAQVLQQLVDRNNLPQLLMRTMMQAVTRFPKLTGSTVTLMSRLISKQIWTYPDLWKGFQLCCVKINPYSLPLFIQLPAQQLETLLLSQKDLQTPFFAWLDSTRPTILPDTKEVIDKLRNPQ